MTVVPGMPLKMSMSQTAVIRSTGVFLTVYALPRASSARRDPLALCSERKAAFRHNDVAGLYAREHCNLIIRRFSQLHLTLDKAAARLRIGEIHHRSVTDHLHGTPRNGGARPLLRVSDLHV